MFGVSYTNFSSCYILFYACISCGQLFAVVVSVCSNLDSIAQFLREQSHICRPFSICSRKTGTNVVCCCLQTMYDSVIQKGKQRNVSQLLVATLVQVAKWYFNKTKLCAFKTFWFTYKSNVVNYLINTYVVMTKYVLSKSALMTLFVGRIEYVIRVNCPKHNYYVTLSQVKINRRHSTNQYVF